MRVVEYTEYLFMTGIRAAAAGLPFMPTKGGMGSDLGAELGFVEIEDPYSDCRVMAVPALHPDVAVVHTRLADPLGNVAARGAGPSSGTTTPMCRGPRAASSRPGGGRGSEDFRARADGVLLYAHEVDAVVHLPGGAFPSGIGGNSTIDVDAVRRYLAHSDADTETALAELFT